MWLVDNKIIEHIFGPNLHVEVRVCVCVRARSDKNGRVG